MHIVHIHMIIPAMIAKPDANLDMICTSMCVAYTELIVGAAWPQDKMDKQHKENAYKTNSAVCCIRLEPVFVT